MHPLRSLLHSYTLSVIFIPQTGFFIVQVLLVQLLPKEHPLLFCPAFLALPRYPPSLRLILSPSIIFPTVLQPSLTPSYNQKLCMAK